MSSDLHHRAFSLGLHGVQSHDPIPRLSQLRVPVPRLCRLPLAIGVGRTRAKPTPMARGMKARRPAPSRRLREPQRRARLVADREMGWDRTLGPDMLARNAGTREMLPPLGGRSTGVLWGAACSNRRRGLRMGLWVGTFVVGWQRGSGMLGWMFPAGCAGVRSSRSRSALGLIRWNWTPSRRCGCGSSMGGLPSG